MNAVRILIVEDDAVLAIHLEEMLKQMGYEVSGLAATGEKAIQSALEQSPEVILMDIRLRGEMTGIQAAEEIHKSSDIPIVYLTAYTDDVLVQQAKLTGAYAYLAKPVRDHELRASLEMAIYKHASEARIQHLNQVLRAVRDVNQLITRQRDPQRLMDEACEILVRTREYKLVWIGDLADDRLKPIASAGQDRDLVDLVFTSANREQADKLLGMESVRTKRPVIRHDFSNDEQYASWREEIQRRGLFSRAAIPMMNGDKFFGVLSVYSERAAIFDENETDLLLELASDLAFGLKSIEDEHERKQAERAFQDSRLQLEGIFNSTMDAIITMDEEQKIVIFNPAAEQMFKCPASEALGQTLDRFLPEYVRGEHKKFVRTFGQSASTKRTMKTPLLELTCFRSDGQAFPSEISISRLEIGEQKLYTAIIRDITERKQAEEKLRESEELYHGLFENMLNGFAYCKMLFDQGRPADFIYLDVNNAFESLTGLKNVVGKKVSDVIPGIRESDPEIFEIYGRVALGGDSEKFEAYVQALQMWFSISVYSFAKEYFVAVFDVITERKQAEERIKRHIEQLTALNEIDRMITSSFDLRLSLNSIVDRVISQQKVDAADILLMNPDLNQLEFGAGYGFQSLDFEKSHVALSDGHAGRAALSREMIHVADVRTQADSLAFQKRLAGENFVSYFATPLIAKGKVKGVLEIFHRSPLKPDFEWFDFLNTLAGQAAIAIDNATLFGNLQRSNTELALAYDATIEGWSRALDLRDKETEGHSLRVTELTVSLAGKFGVRDAELVQIRWGALLHDIGKMGLPDSILLKPDALTDEEWALMRTHPAVAYQLLSPIGFLRSALDIPYCHHERWDGSGYPRGLKGGQIPLAARIFAVVDVWDALTSDRVYRKAWPNEKALEYIRSQAGTHFDPQVVKVCFESGLLGLKSPGQG